MKWLWLLLIALSFQPAFGKKRKLDFDAMLDLYSLDQMEQAANYFMARVELDPLPKGQKLIKCDPPMVKVNAWMSGPMARLSEERRKREVDVYVRDAAGYLARIKSCADKCTCPAYKAVVEMGGKKGALDPAGHEKNVNAIKHEMRKVSEKLRRKCAVQADWICGSELQKYLMSPAAAKFK